MAEPENTHGTAEAGGKYIQGDRYVDAEGKDLGAAPKSATEAKNETAQPQIDRNAEVPRKTDADRDAANDTARKSK